MTPVRVLVVDDSVVIRHLIGEVVKGDEMIEIVGTARNGYIALEEIERLEPDLVTLDIEMPEMDGLETLRRIRAQRPRLPVIMFSTLTANGAAATVEALTAGASDYVTKPSNAGSMTDGLLAVRDQLVPKIRSLCGRPPLDEPSAVEDLPASGPAAAPSVAASPARTAPRPAAAPLGAVSLLVIGCSTGGPAALAEIWPLLPADCPVPVLLVQHMPPMFTGLLAARLTKLGAIPTAEGEEGLPIVRGEARIAPGDHHMELDRVDGEVVLRLHQGPPENSCRPSVEPLFRSAAALFGAGVLAVVLTGMGNDGLDGCRHVVAAGGQVIVQDEESSVVWGMPGAVSRAGLAQAELPLGEIAAEINARLVARPGARRAVGVVAPGARHAHL